MLRAEGGDYADGSCCLGWLGLLNSVEMGVKREDG